MSQVRVLGFDATQKAYLPLAIDNTTGGVKTDVDTSLLASSANQVSANASLSSIDTKITACDTSALATSAAQGVANSSLASIDGKITACDTTNLATSALQTSGNASLSTIAGAVSANKMQVEQATAQLGGLNNLANNVTLNFGANSSSVAVSGFRASNIYYEDSLTGSFDGLVVEASPDNGTTYVDWYQIYPYASGGLRRAQHTMDLSGFTHIRLRNVSTTDNYSNAKAWVVSQS